MRTRLNLYHVQFSTSVALHKQICLSNKQASPPCCCNVAHGKYRLIPLVCPACLHVFVIKQTSRSLRNANLQWLRCGWLVTKVLCDSHSLMQAFGYRFCRSIVFPLLLISLLRLPYKKQFSHMQSPPCEYVFRLRL